MTDEEAKELADSMLKPDADPLFAEWFGIFLETSMIFDEDAILEPEELFVTEEIELPEPGQPRQGPGLGEYFLKNMKD